LTARAVAYCASRDLIPYYGVYSLLFGDRGLSAAQISSLFIIWSLAGIVFEVPSGAWADTVDRRRLLRLSAAIYVVAFAAWTVFPGYPGFAAGFALWGLSSALMSGTFEALLYETLAARSAADAYPRLMGWTRSAAIVAVLAGTALGAPLYARGGYPLVGWASVAAAMLHFGLAWTLPTDRSVRPTVGPRRSTRTRYLAMLRAGVGEAARHEQVRRLIAVYAVLFGLTAYDEYFPILARDGGVATVDVPLLVGVMMLGQVVGTALAGRTAAMSGRVMAVLIASSAVLVSVGALSIGPLSLGPLSLGPLGVAPLGVAPLGIAAITIGYGIVHNTIIVAEARLQQLITSDARATVTSVAGLSTEVVVLAVYASFALGSSWLPIATIVALLGLPMLGVAAAARRRLPPPEESE
jgi:MFS family permease